ncbi:GAK10 protein, partial [Ploceus nigricollis]|nr:GAK10 protein [Ploceus nigricollis]
LDSIYNHANVELADYIKACANIGSEQYKAEQIASTITQQLQAAKAIVKCFACRDEWRIQKQCPKGQKTSKKPNKPCSHCKKGLLWNSQPHSKFDKDDNTLQKQGKLNRGLQADAPQPNGATIQPTPN